MSVIMFIVKERSTSVSMIQPISSDSSGKRSVVFHTRACLLFRMSRPFFVGCYMQVNISGLHELLPSVEIVTPLEWFKGTSFVALTKLFKLVKSVQQLFG